MKAIYVLLTCSALLLWGCKPKTATPEYFNYSFRNNLGLPARVVIYATEEDYGNNQHATDQFLLDAGQSHTVVLKGESNVYLDWYTDDYSYSNWARDGSASPLWLLPVSPRDKELALSWLGGGPDAGRKILLNGGGTKTEWKSIGEWSSGSQLLPATEQKLEFSKLHTVKYTPNTASPEGVIPMNMYYGAFTTSTNSLLAYLYNGGSVWGRFVYDPMQFPMTTEDTLMLEIAPNNGSANKRYLFVKE